MPVDPQVQVLLDAMAAVAAPPLHHLSPDAARDAYAALAAARKTTDTVAATEDHAVPAAHGDIAVRLYRPRRRDSGPAPVVVFSTAVAG